MTPSPSELFGFKNVDTVGGSVSIAKVGTSLTAKTFQYSTDGTTWNTYTEGQAVATAPGDSVYFRSTDGVRFSISNINYRYFVLSGQHEATGKISDIGPMGTGSYSYSFLNCTGLTKAPRLTSLVLSESCYSNMFEGCTSLTLPPELPATSLADECYSDMFKGCTSLHRTPRLPAKTLANSCYLNMFDGCTSLIETAVMSATKLATLCCASMYSRCTNLVKANALPVKTMAPSCYSSMFNECRSLTESPKLPATRLASDCYKYMFSRCSALEKVWCNALYKEDGTAITDRIALEWLRYTPTTGTFYKNASLVVTTRDYNTIPAGWTLAEY